MLTRPPTPTPEYAAVTTLVDSVGPLPSALTTVPPWWRTLRPPRHRHHPTLPLVPPTRRHHPARPHRTLSLISLRRRHHPAQPHRALPLIPLTHRHHPARPRHALPLIPCSRRDRPARRGRTLPLIALALLIPLHVLAPPAQAAPPPWRWPLDGHPQVLRRFAPPPAPWLSGHRGVDLAAPTGTPVLAAGPGTVSHAGPVAGTGVVSIKHADGLRTTYLPLTPSVREGQPVAGGDRIGTVAEPTGHCRTSCLHWGLLDGPDYANPLMLLARGDVRLLPYWSSPPEQAPPLPDRSQPHLPPPHAHPRDSPQSPSASPGRPARLSTQQGPRGRHLPSLTLSAAASSAAAAPAIGAGALIAAALLFAALRRRRPRGGHHHTDSERLTSKAGRHRRGVRRRTPKP
ncbi:M23 family metallopeptidase [Nonomuraea pusilla]|uniref:M23 family metallopeptidase n=1 Tax=Nonomuraea pusilla TaxID=46177 RepID=UPI0033317979